MQDVIFQFSVLTRSSAIEETVHVTIRSVIPVCSPNCNHSYF